MSVGGRGVGITQGVVPTTYAKAATSIILIGKTVQVICILQETRWISAEVTWSLALSKIKNRLGTVTDCDLTFSCNYSSFTTF